MVSTLEEFLSKATFELVIALIVVSVISVAWYVSCFRVGRWAVKSFYWDVLVKGKKSVPLYVTLLSWFLVLLIALTMLTSYVSNALNQTLSYFANVGAVTLVDTPMPKCYRVRHTFQCRRLDRPPSLAVPFSLMYYSDEPPIGFRVYRPRLVDRRLQERADVLGGFVLLDEGTDLKKVKGLWEIKILPIREAGGARKKEMRLQDFGIALTKNVVFEVHLLFKRRPSSLLYEISHGSIDGPFVDSAIGEGGMVSVIGDSCDFNVIGGCHE